MRNTLRTSISAFCYLFAVLLSPWSSAQTVESTDHAVELLNRSEYSSSARELEGLIRSNPNNFYAYRLLWDALAHLDSNKTLLEKVGTDLGYLNSVPKQNRNEFFYNSAVYGNELLGRLTDSEAMRKEEITAFPKGRAAQVLAMQKATKETDPQLKIVLYSKFVEDFPGSIASDAYADEQIFYIEDQHPDFFSRVQIVRAAEAWNSIEERLAKISGRGSTYLSTLLATSKALLAIDPTAALQVESRAIRFTADTWPKDDSIDLDSEKNFGPVQLQTYLALEQWDEARRIARQLLPELEKGKLPNGLTFDPVAEAALRVQCGVALERSGLLDDAFRQFGIASLLDAATTTHLQGFISKHQEFNKPLDRDRQSWRLQIDIAEKEKVNEFISEIIGKELDRPGTEFRVTGFDGTPLTLSSFRGHRLILVFWASWCPYCDKEFKELSAISDGLKRKDTSILAVSVDTDHNSALAFLKKQSISFPLAFSDGTMDAAYDAQVVPHVAVLDTTGHIRFHLSGDDPQLTRTLFTMVDLISQ